MSPDEVLTRMRVPDFGTPEGAGLYVLGCLQRPLTFHSQQQRAFNLIWALSQKKLVGPQSRIAIVGGGLAGVTAATAALLCELHVTLLERNQQLLDLQTGNKTRFVHPNLYDWPRDTSENTQTSLPDLNWEADDAAEVIRNIRQQWVQIKQEFQMRPECLLRVIPRCNIKKLQPEGNKIRVSTDLNSFEVAHDETYDCVILAVGFGLEKGLPPIPMRSYWLNDEVRPELTGEKNPCTVLVTGCGDGAITDVLALRVYDFDQSHLHKWLRFPDLKDSLLSIDQKAQAIREDTEQRRFIYEQYLALKLPSENRPIPERRKDTKVILNGTGDQPYELGASILNRFALFVLKEILKDKGLHYRRGKLSEGCITRQPDGTYEVSAPDWKLNVDKVIVRQGAESALGKHFPEILRSCQSLQLTGPDPTRYACYGNFFPNRRRPPSIALTNNAEDNRPIPCNLPKASETIVGQDEYLLELRRELEAARLLTLTGPGGAGKTTLAAELARQSLDLAPGGAWFVSLGNLTDALAIPAAFAAAMNLRELHGEDIIAVAKQVISDKPTLLVLDNCEHLREACASLINQLVQHCSRLKVIATSRERLDAEGERVMRVPLLPYPDRTDPQDPESTLKYAAVKLFVDRAAKASGLKLDKNNAGDIAHLCRQLDGLPFAIVLAAGRTPELSVKEIMTGLDNLFQLLRTTSRRDHLEHHLTLRATVQWSYQLLPQNAKRLMHHLWVFKGGWDVAGARAVCPENEISSSEFFDVHTQLVRASLVERDGTRHSRYRMLETTRQFCRDSRNSKERGRIYSRHFDFALSLAKATKSTNPRNAVDAFDKLELDYDNIRAALRRTHNGRMVDKFVALTTALDSFWLQRGYFTEGRQWLKRAMGHKNACNPHDRADMISSFASIAFRQGDYEVAVRYYNEAIRSFRGLANTKGEVESRIGLGRLLREMGDRTKASIQLNTARKLASKRRYFYLLARALSNLGIVAADKGRGDEARQFFERSKEIGERLSNDFLQGVALNNLGVVERNAGKLDVALELHRKSRRFVERASGNKDVALDYYNTGIVLWHMKRFVEARQHFNLALENGCRLGDKRIIALSLEGLGRVCAWHPGSNAASAAKLFGAASKLRKVIKSPLEPNEKADYDRAILVVRNLLGEKEFKLSFDQGYKMSNEEALEFARSEMD